MELDASLHQADIALVGLLTILGLLLVPLHSNVLVLTDSLESLRVLRRGTYNPLLDRLSRVVQRHVLSGSLSPRLSFTPDNFNVRAEQLARGLTISTGWSFNFQTSRTRRISAPIRPLLLGSQQPLRSVHVPLPRSPGSRIRRIQPLLGQLGSTASVPPDSVDFIGFDGTVINSFRHRNLYVPGAGGLGLGSRPVLPSSRIVPAILPPAPARSGLPYSPTGTDASVPFHLSEGFPDGVVSPLFLHQSLCLFPYALHLPRSVRATGFISWPLRDNILRREGVVSLSQCTLRHAVKFLTLLFKQRDIIASTVAHYRAALSFTLRIIPYFALLIPALSALLWTMSHRRTSRPLTAPS